MHIPRSTFYARRKQTEAQRKDLANAKVIAEIQKSCGFTIGRRRMPAALKAWKGLELGESQCQRLMSSFGLQAIIRQIRKTRPCTRHPQTSGLPGNILDRRFTAAEPMSRLLTDVTYVPYFENGEYHWGYLSLVLDLFDRSIVAWVYSKKQDTGLAMSTLQCLENRGFASGAMLHSDHGNIYTAQDFRRRLTELGVTQSLSRVGNCHDNAPMECFNGTLKVEQIFNPLLQKEKASFLERNAEIGEYIEYYNNERPSSLCGYLPPVKYRELLLKKSAKTALA